jgi:hypothetical protein
MSSTDGKNYIRYNKGRRIYETNSQSEDYGLFSSMFLHAQQNLPVICYVENEVETLTSLHMVFWIYLSSKNCHFLGDSRWMSTVPYDAFYWCYFLTQFSQVLLA